MMVKLFNFNKLKYNDILHQQQSPNLENFLKHDIYLDCFDYFQKQMF
jgi:hypothetical protein